MALVYVVGNPDDAASYKAALAASGHRAIVEGVDVLPNTSSATARSDGLVAEMAQSDVFLIVMPLSELPPATLMQVGIAIGAAVPVIVVGELPYHSNFHWHSVFVSRFNSLGDAAANVGAVMEKVDHACEDYDDDIEEGWDEDDEDEDLDDFGDDDEDGPIEKIA